MYARVATFQGDPAGLDKTIAEIKSMVESGEAPPPGLEDSTFMMLVDKESGKTMGVSLFQTEEARQRGHEALEAMSPPDDGMRRSSVDFYEVPISTVPPQVLAQLPKLPEELEYRFIQTTLILFDSHAHIIADFVERAIQ